MKIILYILAAIAILLGVLFLVAAFNITFHPDWFIIAVALIGVGLALVWFGTRQKPAVAGDQNVTVNIDLPANIDMDKFQCQNCGGALTTENVKLVAGAPVVTCPYCGTSYQLSEEPKW